MRTHKSYKFSVFGSRLRSMILQQDADINSFIQRSGLGQKVYRYVLGESYPPPYAMMKICETLDCTVEDIMDPVMSDEELRTGTVLPSKKKGGVGGPFQLGRVDKPEYHIRNKEEKEIVTSVQSLLPGAAEKLESFLDSPDTGAMAKVRICKLILNRTYGKPKPAKRKASENETWEQSLNYIEDLASRAAGDGKETGLE